MAGRRFHDETVDAKSQGFSGKGVVLIEVGDHHHAVAFKDIDNCKGQIRLRRERLSPIAAQGVAPVQLTLPHEAHRFLGSEDDIRAVVRHDPVEVVGIPGGFPRIGKGAVVLPGQVRTSVS